MSDDKEPVVSIRRIKKYTWILSFIWFSLIIISLIWNLIAENHHTREIAKTEARSNFNKDKAIRYWATKHGGVYVPMDKRTPANPYLSHIEDRIIIKPNGDTLTLMNPAYMIRQMFDEFPKEYGAVGRIVSLKPLNINNTPDEWERKALLSFEKGNREAHEFTEKNGAEYIRLMQPLITEQGCLKCHAFQGYKMGEIRGGVGVLIPMEPFLKSTIKQRNTLFFLHAIFMTVGFIGIGFGSKRFIKGIEERGRVETERLSAEQAGKQAEQKLVQNQYYLTKAQEIGSIGTWELDLIKNELIWTEQNYINFGVPIGTPLTYEIFLECIHPDDRDYVNEKWRAAIDGKPYDIEHRLLVDSKVRWVREKAEVEFDDNNKAISAIGFTQDITERKQAEVALRESEERFRLLFDKAPLGYQSLNRDGQFIEVNQTWLDSLGYTREEVIGKWFGDFMTPDSQEKVRQRFPDFVKNGKVHTEFELIHKNGNILTISFDGRIGYDLMGDFKQTHCILNDITKRKQSEEKLKESEEKFRGIYEQSPIAIEIYNKHGKLIDVNQQTLNMFGVDDKKHVLGFDLWDDPNLSDEKMELLKSGQEIFLSTEFDFEIVKKNKLYPTGRSGKIYMDMYAIPLLNEKEITGFLVQIVDTTERKQAEEAIIESQRLGAIGEMTSAVAHDFNNSLQTIFGNLELALLNPDIPERVRQYLKVVKDASGDAAARVQLLQRFGGNKQSKSHHSSINVNTVVSDVITQSRPLWKDEAEKKGLQIIIVPKYGEIPKIKGNDGELRSVVYNVIKNAVEAMPKGGEITIETGKESESVFVRITDSGKGMDDETKTRIFQPFYSTKGFELGRGLGMSGAYTILQEHEGNIKVKETAPDKGTTIEIILPVSVKNEISEDNEPVAGYEGKAKILWVDDDKSICEVAKEMLDCLGHDGDVALSGKEALEYLAKKTYDLVITDLGMPGMTGWQLADEIKKLYKGKIKVAIVTGWGSQVSEEEKATHGVGYVLGKPVKLRDVESLIGEVMQIR